MGDFACALPTCCSEGAGIQTDQLHGLARKVLAAIVICLCLQFLGINTKLLHLSYKAVQAQLVRMQTDYSCKAMHPTCSLSEAARSMGCAANVANAACETCVQALGVLLHSHQRGHIIAERADLRGMQADDLP